MKVTGDKLAAVRDGTIADTPPPEENAELVETQHLASQAAFADLVNREELVCRHSWDLLGGKRFWSRRLTNKSEVHTAILHGVQYKALIFFVSQLTELDEVDFIKVPGISARTLRRQSETPENNMSVDLASKAWLFAETLAKAAEVFGSKEAAERWMSKPAMGLNGQRPIELLQTVQGAELVNDFLGRLEYGVYV